MTSRSKGMVVAVVVGLALAVTATSASARLPEFKFAGSSPKFTGTAVGVNVFTKIGTDYRCKAASVTGELEGTDFTKKVKNVVLKFTGCAGFFTFCNGEWQTKPLVGTLGFISKEEHRVGLLLDASSGPIAECALEVAGDIVGSVIAEIAPVNEKKKELTLGFEHTSPIYEQLWQHFEGETESHHLAFQPGGTKEMEPLAMVTKPTLTFEREVEVEG
jgi:hypothetical protein